MQTKIFIFKIDKTDVSNWPKGAISKEISGPVGATVARGGAANGQAG